MAEETINDFYLKHLNELQQQAVLNDLQPQVDDVQTLLSDLNSNSKVAEHRLWVFDFSVFSWMFQQLFANHKAEVQEIVSNNAYGHARWWVDIVKQYQHGYLLTFVNNRPTYQVIDEAAQIVKRAACVHLGGGAVLIKANKLVNGEAVMLDPNEVSGLEEFIHMIQPPGVPQLLSLNPDKLRLTAKAYLNPMVFNSDGSLISDGSFPVVEAANEYLADLPYNGNLSLTQLKDKVQEISGVNDFVIDSATVLQGINTFNVDRIFPTLAGTIKQDDTAGFTFSDTFTYEFGE